MTNKFITVPGVYRPTVMTKPTAPRTATRNAVKDVPVGENVAKVFPWITGFKQVVSGVQDAETKLVRPGSGAASFMNNTDRTLKVHEIRFFAQNPTAAPFPPMFQSQLMINNRMGLKVKHTDYEIVSDWLPAGMLSTKNNIIGMAARCNLCMTLPTTYYLQGGHPFRLRIRSTNVNFDPTMVEQPYIFQMTLFGKDPRTNKPYEQIKQIFIPYLGTALPTDALPQYVDVVFDDDRDTPMRDLLLTHIGFNLMPFDDGHDDQRYVYMYSQQLEMQFIAPEGPKWMDFADWVPIANLVDQGTTPSDLSYVAYRPDVPMTLTPRQQIDIDVKALRLMAVPSPGQPGFALEVPLWVTLLGTQEQKVEG
jgi:hypothetical protein